MALQPGNRVKLHSPKGHLEIQTVFPDMPYLGIWQAAGKQAPYICLEPWSSLPSRQNIVEDLEKQENLLCLASGERYTNQWSISLI